MDADTRGAHRGPRGAANILRNTDEEWGVAKFGGGGSQTRQRTVLLGFTYIT